jgi:hypothetical protein
MAKAEKVSCTTLATKKRETLKIKLIIMQLGETKSIS